MPKYEKHLETSRKRTGKDYQVMHDWLDNYPEMKADRHNLDKLAENICFVRSSWGEEAVVEYLQHLVEDAAMQDLAVLMRLGTPAETVAHSIEVARKAVEISSRVCRMPLERNLIIRSAVYHDLGKSKTATIEHGEIGAQLGLELGLEDSVIQIMRKHIRGGMTKAEAVELGLPERDYALKTPEEKMVVYADKLVEIYTDGLVPGINEHDAEKRFAEILHQYEKYRKNQATLERYLALHREIHDWMLQK